MHFLGALFNLHSNYVVVKSMQQPPTDDYSIVQFVMAMSIVGSIHGYNLGQLSFVHVQRRSKMLKGRKRVLPKVFSKRQFGSSLIFP
jgi:hypothetical protein